MSRTRLAIVAVGAAAALAAPAALATSGTAATSTTPARQAQAALPYENADLPVRQRVADLLQRMTLAEKIGQMTQAERAEIEKDPTKLAKLNLGSVLSGGGSTPTPNTPTAWADMVDRYQKAALTTRLHIPLLYGVDTVHGHGNLYGATVFPHNIGLGATRDPALVKRIAQISAEETRSTGPQWAFAPCLCVARDDRWGRTYESFGEDPKLVEQMAVAIDGLQGNKASGLARPNRVLASAKHFAGNGLTTYGTGSNLQNAGEYPIDQGVTQTDRATFQKLALDPFVPAVQDHEVGTVMPSYSDVDWTEDGLGNRTNMHASTELIQGWLKDQEGFDGFVISDYNGIDHIDAGVPGATFADRVRKGVNAGIDMFMQPQNFEEFITTLTAEVDAGRVSTARIDDAVSRILTKKFELGLFERPYTDRRNIDQVGSDQHRKVARRAVAASQTLLANRRGALPLSRSTKLYVAGSNANTIGNQAGGWTLTWQGGSTNVIPGQTILQGIRQTSRAGVTFSADASAPIDKRATGVVVVGETPYSEGFGDVGGPQWAFDPGDNDVPRPQQTMKLNAADSAAVDKVCAQAAKCVVIVVSGRPLILPDAQRKRMDALVAAWLPGSEGLGVSDPLFGRTRYGGKLPVSWPRTLAQEPINVGDAKYDPLYRYGFGLTTR